MKATDASICVIICTHNREELVTDCLNSLIRQKGIKEPYSVLVVDNASTDGTSQTVMQFIENNDFDRIKLIHEPRIGLSHARNRGIRESDSRYLAFVDDDARVPENWLAIAFEIIRQHEPDIFGGPARPVFSEGKPDWYKDDYGLRGDMGDSGFLTRGFIVGTNIFFKRELLKKYGGFDPNLGMSGSHIGYHEETKIIQRAFKERKKVYYSKQLAVEDLIPDYKKSLAFFIFSRYKSGKDRMILSGNDIQGGDPMDVLKQVDDLFMDFDNALMNRDISRFKYPENYIVEKMRPAIVDLGKQVALAMGSFPDDPKWENADPDRDSFHQMMRIMVNDLGFFKTLKLFFKTIFKRR